VHNFKISASHKLYALYYSLIISDLILLCYVVIWKRFSLLFLLLLIPSHIPENLNPRIKCWSLVISWCSLCIKVVCPCAPSDLCLQLPTWYWNTQCVASAAYNSLLTCPFQWMFSDLYRPDGGPFRIHERLKMEDLQRVCLAVQEWWPHELSRFSKQKPLRVCIVTWRDGVCFLISWCCDHMHCLSWIKAGTQWLG